MAQSDWTPLQRRAFRAMRQHIKACAGMTNEQIAKSRKVVRGRMTIGRLFRTVTQTYRERNGI